MNPTYLRFVSAVNTIFYAVTIFIHCDALKYLRALEFSLRLTGMEICCNEPTDRQNKSRGVKSADIVRTCQDYFGCNLLSTTLQNKIYRVVPKSDNRSRFCL